MSAVGFNRLRTFFQMRKDALPRGLRNRVFSLLIGYRSRSVACKLTGHLIEFVHSWKNTKFVCFFLLPNAKSVRRFQNLDFFYKNFQQQKKNFYLILF